MPKRSRRTRKPDENEIAHRIIRVATGQESAPEESGQLPKKKKRKNPAAVALGKLGGRKGGPARAKKLSKARRREIASSAAKARWSK